MNLLLVEDENDKSEDIITYIKNEFEGITLDLSKSYTTAIEKIYMQQYDMILLDMTLPFTEIGEPNFDNNEFETFGGKNILDELKRINYQTKVVVITAFDILRENDKIVSLAQLDESMKYEYKKIYVGCIYYNSSSIEWKYRLKEQIEKCTNN